MQKIEILLSDGSKVSIWETGSRSVAGVLSHDLQILIKKPNGDMDRETINLSKNEDPKKDKG